MILEDTKTTKYIKNSEGCVVGLLGTSPVKEEKNKIVVMVGPSGMGRSMKLAMTAATSAGFAVEERSINSSKKMIGLNYDLLATDEISRLSDALETYDQMNQRVKECFLTYDPIKEHHVGKGDPMGLRQQFNRKGKKFR